MLWNVPKLGEAPHTRADVFISPVNLTANGPAHLGHAGGPYLRMDTLARHLKRLGHKVISALTTDQFENHIEAQALKAGIDRADFARRNDEAIREGLSALGILYDVFPNTGTAEVSIAFAETALSLITALDCSSGYIIQEQILPVDDALPPNFPIEDRFCIGGWFACLCPSCGTPAGSYFCEQCGAHFSPSEGVAPQSRRGVIVGWSPSHFAFLGDGLDTQLRTLWDKMKILPEYRAISEAYLNKNGSKMQLSIPSTYGYAWPNEGFTDRQALFSYSSLLYAHSLFCGALSYIGTKDESPFARGDKTILLSATAIDNVIPMMIGLSGTALSQDTFRPFDRIYFNKFLRLEGDKFSTSRNHVIWALDISQQQGINLDFLRAYLCEICPETEETDFLLEEFVGFHNGLRRSISDGLIRCESVLRFGPQELDGCWLAELEITYNIQLKAFDDVNLRIADCFNPLRDWIAKGKQVASSEQAVCWLVGLSYLGSPVIPGLAKHLTEWAGFGPLIHSADIGKPVQVTAKPLPDVPGVDLHISDIEHLIPSSKNNKLKETV